MLFYKHTLIGNVVAMTALCLTSSAHAAPPAGQLLASQCAQCHGTNGNGPGFENLAGRNASSMYNDLREMKARPVEGIMDRQARGYTDTQLRLISEYFASLPGSGGD